MNFGYVKNNSLLSDEADYNQMFTHLKVDRIFVDRHGEKAALNTMIQYVRKGDCIVVENIFDVCNSVGEFIELVLKLHDVSVSLVCRDQNIDTSDQSWLSVLEILRNVKNNVNSNIYITQNQDYMRN